MDSNPECHKNDRKRIRATDERQEFQLFVISRRSDRRRPIKKCTQYLNLNVKLCR